MTRAHALREAFRRARRDVWAYRQAVLEARLRPRGEDWPSYG